MRKAILLFLILSLLFAVGCGQKSKVDTIRDEMYVEGVDIIKFIHKESQTDEGINDNKKQKIYDYIDKYKKLNDLTMDEKVMLVKIEELLDSALKRRHEIYYGDKNSLDKAIYEYLGVLKFIMWDLQIDIDEFL